MDINNIKQLIDLMEERSLSALEVQEGEKKVHITRHLPQATPITVTQGFATPTNITTPEVQTTPKGAIETSPMVGVFYAAPSPNDPPFVKVGQQVEAGDTLGIIEAMKIMNPLEATQSGIIEAILVENGDVVQFGQPVIRYQS